jgi:hypothetical protein
VVDCFRHVKKYLPLFRLPGKWALPSLGYGILSRRKPPRHNLPHA